MWREKKGKNTVWGFKRLSHHLKDVWSFIKINRCKKDFVSESRGIPPGVSQYLELLISLPKIGGKKHFSLQTSIKMTCFCCSWFLPADPTLSLWLQCCEHDNNRVVSRGSLNKATEFIAIHSDDWTFGSPLHHLSHLLWQQSLNTDRQNDSC